MPRNEWPECKAEDCSRVVRGPLRDKFKYCLGHDDEMYAEELPLKPCPFCGNLPREPKLEDYGSGPYGGRYWQLGCYPCGVVFKHMFKGEAARKWNTRRRAKPK